MNKRPGLTRLGGLGSYIRQFLTSIVPPFGSFDNSCDWATVLLSATFVINVQVSIVLLENWKTWFFLIEPAFGCL